MTTELSFDPVFQSDLNEACATGNAIWIPPDITAFVTDAFKLTWNKDITSLQLTYDNRAINIPITNDCANYKDNTVDFSIKFERHDGQIYLTELSFQAPK